uniref:Uncharacterized protein n=1 Tax=Anguilla anguilla TaxID=7936 RepID=A0A0E9Y191_ANGAN
MSSFLTCIVVAYNVLWAKRKLSVCLSCSDYIYFRKCVVECNGDAMFVLFYA